MRHARAAARRNEQVRGRSAGRGLLAPRRPPSTRDSFAAFNVRHYSTGGKGYNTTLLDDYITLKPGTNDWCRTCTGAVVIRLTE